MTTGYVSRTLVNGRTSAARSLVNGRDDAPDPAAPVASSITATGIGDNTATISWSLDQPATGQVDYGITTAYGASTTAETSFDYSAHAQGVFALSEGTLYHYRVRGANAAGLPYVSGDNTFTTTTSAITFTDYTVPGGISTISGLQSWVDFNLASGTSTVAMARLILSNNATYTGTLGLDLTGYDHLWVEGGGSDTSRGHTGGSMIYVNGPSRSDKLSSNLYWKSATASASATNVVIHGLTLRGSCTAYATTASADGGEYQHGLCLFGVVDIEVSHCIIERVQGRGLAIGASKDGVTPEQRTSDLWVHHSTFRDIGAMGWSIVDGEDILIEECELNDVGYAPVNVEMDFAHQVCDNVEIRNCEFTGGFGWSYNQIDALVSITAQADGVNATLSGYFRFDDNTITATDANGGTDQRFFYALFGTGFDKTATLSIQRNTCSSARVGPAVYLANWTNGGTVSDNTGFLSSGAFTSISTSGAVTESGNT